MSPAYPAIPELVPHADPIIVIDRMVAWEPGHAVCTTQLRADSPFVRNGVLNTPTTLEHMAQTVAACLGYEAFQGGHGVRVGMIIGCKKFTVHCGILQAGDRLRIQADRVRGNDTLSHFDCSVSREDERVAAGTLLLFHGEKPPD